MARARNIKPGFFTNGDLLECQPLARLLFAGLWCEADRRGILEDRPKTLKVKILPGDNCEIDELLTELVDRGFIHRYEAEGRKCIAIPNFQKHQNPHINERANDLPIPVEHDASTVQAPEQHSTNPADSLLPITDSSIPPNGGRTSESAAAPRSLPTNGAAQQIVARYCELSGVSEPASYSKAVGQAAQLVKAGVTVDQLPDLYGFVASWSNGVDLGSLVGNVDKWREGRARAPTDPHAEQIRRNTEAAKRELRRLDQAS